MAKLRVEVRSGRVPEEEKRIASSEEHPMNETGHRTTAARRYLRYLARCAHEAGLPFLPIDDLSERRVHEWIDYLRIVITAQERVECLIHEGTCRVREEGTTSPYLLTPGREQLPAKYRPPWQELPDAEDHDHIVGTVSREDGLVESVCVLCGSSA
jgi:hypothetical protein